MKNEKAVRLNKTLLIFLFFSVIVIIYLWWLIRANQHLLSNSEKKSYNPPNNFINKQTISADEIFILTNQEREKTGLKALKRSSKLDEAALLRAKDIISTQDWSHEAPHSGLTYEVALNKVKYYNIRKGENLAEGQWSSEAVIKAWMESKEHKENILDSTFQEIGIATFSGELNGTKNNIITVQLFGGYIPPNYKNSDIESWEKSLSSLRGVLPSWENIRNSPNRYPNNKDKAERIIQIINIRISRIQAIVNRERANQWLTAEETKWTNEDLGLYNEQQSLADFLNSQAW